MRIKLYSALFRSSEPVPSNQIQIHTPDTSFLWSIAYTTDIISPPRELNLLVFL